MHRPTLLVIDDDNTLLYAIRKSLENSNLRVIIANSATAGIRQFEIEAPTVVLLDLRLNEHSGLDVLNEIRKINDQIPVIMFTAFSTAGTTIEATRSGAFDYLLKPVDLNRLRDTVDRAIKGSLAQREEDSVFSSFAPVPGPEVTIIGSSPAMQEIYKQIGRFAGSNGNVLILGESGTGKDLVAHAIHQHSLRQNKNIVAINCAALSETLLESELFGHERGAFTGADRRRIGKFEHANGGTIFLDEVADMSPATQAKLLRLLQDQNFERLGGNETIRTDVRLVAATNKNLETLITQNLFREDLYYRLNVFNIKLPPLRDRLEDIPELVNYFLENFKKEFGKNNVKIRSEVIEILKGHNWPGNMRELQSVVKHALAHSVGSVIAKEHLPQKVLSQEKDTDRGRINSEIELNPIHFLAKTLIAQNDTNIYHNIMKVIDQTIIPLVLDHTSGNLQHACDLLGISRNTLKSKMRGNHISVETVSQSKIDERTSHA